MLKSMKSKKKSKPLWMKSIPPILSIPGNNYQMGAMIQDTCGMLCSMPPDISAIDIQPLPPIWKRSGQKASITMLLFHMLQRSWCV